MPAVSRSQQRLMAQAYQVRKYMDTGGDDGIDPRGINGKYREEVVDLAKSMSKKDLEKFAGTPHAGLPERKVKEDNGYATVDSVNGMGPTTFPGADGQGTGSGDLAEPGRRKKKKKGIRLARFDEFLKDDPK